MAIIGAIFLFSVNNNTRLIFTPIIISIILVVYLFSYLYKQEERVPIFDIGMFCCILVALYTSYPLLNYYFGGFSFGLLGDGRLTSYAPTPTEVGIFHLRHVLYLFFLVVFYQLFRINRKVIPSVIIPNKKVVRFIYGGFIFCYLFFLFISLTIGFNFDGGYDSASTDAQITINSNLPLPVLQFAGKIAGLQFIFKIALVAIVILKAKSSKKWTVVFWGWLIFEILISIIAKGSRDSLMFFLLSTILLYTHLYKSLSLRVLGITFLFVFVFFMFIGFYRALDDISSWGYVFDSLDVVLSANNEFQALFGTAFDVFQLKEIGTKIPWQIYINDIMPLLPPSQFLPFEKIEASEWYLRELGISGTGQGFMWGVITQAIVGFDWFELVIRGSFLGFFLAKIHNFFFVKRAPDFMMLVFYIVLILNVYNTYRNTTGAILYPIFWEILPFFVLMKLFTLKKKVSSPIVLIF